MISFELFDKIISSIKEQDKIDEDVGRALELVCDSWVMFNTKNKKYWALSELLKETMNDDGDWISWWIYEHVEKAWWDKKNNKHDLSTTKKLYDFLVNNGRKLKNKNKNKK
jgi:hypothetical protein